MCILKLIHALWHAVPKNIAFEICFRRRSMQQWLFQISKAMHLRIVHPWRFFVFFLFFFCLLLVSKSPSGIATAESMFRQE